MAKKKAKTKVVEEEIIEGDEVKTPFKSYKWSNNGLKYQIVIEMDDSKPGTRHFQFIHECEELSEAKKYSLAKYEKENKTIIVYDRSDAGVEVIRHERKITI